LASCDAGHEPAFSPPARACHPAVPLHLARRSAARSVTQAAARGPVTERDRSWGCAASRGLAPARAVPSSLTALLRRTVRLARSPRGAFCLAAKLLLPTSPSPGSPSSHRDCSCGLRHIKARGAVSVAALLPAPDPARESLTWLRSSLLLSRDDELRRTAAAAKRSPPTRQNNSTPGLLNLGSRSALYMGATILTGKCAAAFRSDDGELLYVLFGRHYEKNCYPHTPSWSAFAFGTREEVLRRAFVGLGLLRGHASKSCGRDQA
jgi:hypothetical protein